MIASLTTPFRQFAHEVYVLSQDKIDTGMSDRSANMFTTLSSGANVRLFILFSLVITALFAAAFYLKSLPVFRRLGASIDKSSMWALVLIRIAFGVSLLFSVANSAVYGPELPLASFPLATALGTVMAVSGVALVVGFQVRFFAVLAALVWVFALIVKGPYLLTYVNYFGEALALILLPVQKLSIDAWRKKTARPSRFAAYSVPVARILFAASILYTAITIKFAATALTLDVAVDYELSRYFPFEPMFIVLGASFIEVLVGLLFLFGFLQRFTSAVFLIVMVLSVIFFKESVWPHLLIIALGIGMFMHKPDIWTIDSRLFVSSARPAHRTLRARQRQPYRA